MTTPGSSAAAALQAVTALLTAGLETGDPAGLARSAAATARDLLGADAAAILALDAAADRAAALATAPAGRLTAEARLADAPALRALLEGGPGGEAADPALRALAGRPDAAAALALPVPVRGGAPLVLVAARDAPFAAEELEAARAFATAVAAALAHVAVARQQAARAAEQAALTRAAGRLGAHLDVVDAVAAICHEARLILGADFAGVYRVDDDGDLVVEADEGLAQSTRGLRLKLGQALAGKVAATGRALYTDDYTAMANPHPATALRRVRTCYGAPLRWDGAVRGALSVGFYRVVPGGRDGLPLLEAFAELASVAYANAEAATRLAVAARTDALTGCLNHGAFLAELHRETERAERTGRAPALVLLDLDRFKEVNDEHGHRAGDDLLRATGEALRAVTREYDLVGRIGGDEFAVLLVDADGMVPAAAARRLLRQVEAARAGVGVAPSAATAGLARWEPGATADGLLAAADGALVAAKRRGERGTVHEQAIDRGHAPARLRRASRQALRSDDGAARRIRALGLATAIGARLGALTDVDQIARVVVEELHAAFDFHLAAVVRLAGGGQVEAIAARGNAFEDLVAGHWRQPRHLGLIGRCLREGSPVRSGDVGSEPEYEATDHTLEVRSELVVPLRVEGRLWGVINVEDVEPDAFDEDDARLLTALADLTAGALAGALRAAALERAAVAATGGGEVAGTPDERLAAVLRRAGLGPEAAPGLPGVRSRLRP